MDQKDRSITIDYSDLERDAAGGWAHSPNDLNDAMTTVCCRLATALGEGTSAYCLRMYSPNNYGAAGERARQRLEDALAAKAAAEAAAAAAAAAKAAAEEAARVEADKEAAEAAERAARRAAREAERKAAEEAAAAEAAAAAAAAADESGIEGDDDATDVEGEGRDRVHKPRAEGEESIAEAPAEEETAAEGEAAEGEEAEEGEEEEEEYVDPEVAAREALEAAEAELREAAAGLTLTEEDVLMYTAVSRGSEPLLGKYLMRGTGAAFAAVDAHVGMLIPDVSKADVRCMSTVSLFLSLPPVRAGCVVRLSCRKGAWKEGNSTYCTTPPTRTAPLTREEDRIFDQSRRLAAGPQAQASVGLGRGGGAATAEPGD